MDIWSQYVLPCLCAFAGCIGFTLVFNIHGPGKLIAGCGGALGWLVYLLAGKTILAGFFAAMAISLFSEVMARIRRCPVTGYQLVALLPLVPGGGIYYAMGYCLEGDTEQFLSALLGTLGMAAALAVGVILASSLFRAVFPRLARVPKRHALRQAKPINDFFSGPAEHRRAAFLRLAPPDGRDYNGIDLIRQRRTSMYIADLHIHSRFSRATSRDGDAAPSGLVGPAKGHPTGGHRGLHPPRLAGGAAGAAGARRRGASTPCGRICACPDAAPGRRRPGL